MKYALLGYDLDATLDQLAPEDKRVLHQGHAAGGEGSLGDGIKPGRPLPLPPAGTRHHHSDRSQRRDQTPRTREQGNRDTTSALHPRKRRPRTGRPPRRTPPRNPARRDNRDLAAQRAAPLALATQPGAHGSANSDVLSRLVDGGQGAGALAVPYASCWPDTFIAARLSKI
jgi:hypothetical protein